MAGVESNDPVEPVGAEAADTHCVPSAAVPEDQNAEAVAVEAEAGGTGWGAAIEAEREMGQVDTAGLEVAWTGRGWVVVAEAFVIVVGCGRPLARAVQAGEEPVVGRAGPVGADTGHKGVKGG